MSFKYKDEELIINEDGFTYKSMMEKLNNTEVKLMMKVFDRMTEDNLIYLYQTVSKRNKRTVIEQIGIELNLSVKSVQNMISSIISKQDDMRYFLYRTLSPIKGEYFICPELCIRHKDAYEKVYRSIIPKIEANVADKVGATICSI